MLAHDLGFSAEMAHRLGWTVIQSLWEVTVIALVAVLIAAILPRRAVNGRYLVLLAGLFAMLAACAITFTIAPAHSSALIASPGSAEDSSYVAVGPLTDQHASSMLVRDIRIAGQPSESNVIAPSASSRFSRFISALNRRLDRIAGGAGQAWLIGVFILAVWRCGAWVAAQRLRRLQTEPAEGRSRESLQRLAAQIGWTRPVRLLTSRFVQTPMVIGWLRPVILMPAAFLAGLSLPQLEAILAHELAHIRRRDYLVNSLQIAAETLLFYHPATWWISRQIRLLREEACDQIAARACGDSCAYAETLVALEEMRFLGSPALAAGGRNKSELAIRVRRLLGLDEGRSAMGPIPAAIILIGLLLIGANCRSFAGGPASQPSSQASEMPTAQSVAAQLMELPGLVKTFRANAMETDKLEFADSGKIIPTPPNSSWAKFQVAFSGDDLFYRVTLSIPDHDTITVRKNGVISNHFPLSQSGDTNRSEVEQTLIGEVNGLYPWRDTQGYGYFLDPASMKTIKVLGLVTYHQMNCIRFERTLQGTLHTTLAAQIAGHLVPVYDEAVVGKLRLIEETPSLEVINNIPVPKELTHTISGPASEILKISGGTLPAGSKPDAALVFVQQTQFDSVLVNQPLPGDQFDPGWVPGTRVFDWKTRKEFIWQEKEYRAQTSQPLQILPH